MTAEGRKGGIYSEQILGWWLAITRSIIGAASALVLYVFLLSGLAGTEFLSVPLVLVVSFVAGFSERLLLRTIESFENIAIGGRG